LFPSCEACIVSESFALFAQDLIGKGLRFFRDFARKKRRFAQSYWNRLLGSILSMKENDDFCSYYQEMLEGRYDCVDRIVLNGYFPLGHSGGGFRTWWRYLTGSDETLDQEHLLRMAGRFSRRVHAYAKANAIPLIHCSSGERKHRLAEKHLPQDPNFCGLFLILAAKAPALVWKVDRGKSGVAHLEAQKPWPYVNHYHFHFIDKEWGHLTIKMSSHPPFAVQVMLNAHEWVERQARKETVSLQKEGNCFVGGSFQALDRIADTLCENHIAGRLTEVCERWVYSSCLCFALDVEEQRRSRFHYRFSGYQLEYSRNLLFKRGATLDEVYQGVIERSRRLLDVDKIKTLFGCKKRPHRTSGGVPRAVRLERIVDDSLHDITVLKLHFGRMTLKIYDKGERVLRVEAIVHNAKDLRCGSLVEKVPIMLGKLQRMVIDFLNVLQAAHASFLEEGLLDSLPQPTRLGSRRLAGIDLQKARMRTVSQAVIALAAQPGGFTARELAGKVNQLSGTQAEYTPRRAAYDLSKLRGKNLIQSVPATRRYRVQLPGIRGLAGMLVLREKVIRPVLAGICRPRLGRLPKTLHSLDLHYQNLQSEMLLTLRDLALAA